MTPALWAAVIELAAAVVKDVVGILLHASLSPTEKEDEINKLTQELKSTKQRVRDVEL